MASSNQKIGEFPVRTPSIALIAVCLLFFAADAQAYIDPGSGSFLLQGLIAGVLGLGVTLKLYWHRLTGGKAPRDEDLDSED